MAQAQRTEVLKCSVDQLRKVILDYESYPKFLDGIENVKVLSQKGKSYHVEFEINLVKKIQYSLKLEDKGTEISWSFASGDLFKKNEGFWKLKPVGSSEVEATYALDLDFKVFVPGMLTKKLAGSNLPAMMKQFEKRAQTV